MAESTLSYKLSDLQARVLRFLGNNNTYATCTATEQADVDDIIASGVRQFYWPPPIDQTGKSHRWTFMRLEWTMDTTADDWDNELDDDFGRILSDELMFDEDESQTHHIKCVTPEFIYKKRQEDDENTDAPRFFAIQTIAGTKATESHRQEILWYPTPDAVYTVYGFYEPLVDKLSDSYPYPYGGAAHTETIIASCLAVAEERLHDERGIKHQLFIERLAASVSIDKQSSGPRNFGQMRSDEPAGRRKPTRYVKYEGTLYDNR